jgi:hypothetical protein
MGTTEPHIVVCTHCHKDIEACAFCEERCGHEICWRCLKYDLREEIAEPHTHGG